MLHTNTESKLKKLNFMTVYMCQRLLCTHNSSRLTLLLPPHETRWYIWCLQLYLL